MENKLKIKKKMFKYDKESTVKVPIMVEFESSIFLKREEEFEKVLT